MEPAAAAAAADITVHLNAGASLHDGVELHQSSRMMLQLIPDQTFSEPKGRMFNCSGFSLEAWLQRPDSKALIKAFHVWSFQVSVANPRRTAATPQTGCQTFLFLSCKIMGC